MPVAAPLDHVLRHNTWANLTLLEFCRGLQPAMLEMEANGTYGTLYATVQHLVGAEQWYVQLITGDVVGPGRIRRTERRSLDDLVATARAIGARELVIASADDAARTVETDADRTSTVGVILAQLVHHGNEHRTQATTILGANGVEPPPLSAWDYGEAMKVPEAGE